ncbi:hypothetical protein SATRI_v1c05040 [Spiroplasma atrichopogonis]|nr:hypothetical protein SMM_0445 [Spiroplasma mirum ATCC 29335]AKM52999.1 hypothetical protein SATRI_v1c05040 [Spiroplasma atrichopogonis]
MVELAHDNSISTQLENLIIKNLYEVTKHNESTTLKMLSTSLENKFPSYGIIQKYHEYTNKINSLSHFRYFAELYHTNNPYETFKKDNFSNSFMIPYEILNQIKSEIFTSQKEKYKESIFKNKCHEIIEKIMSLQQKFIKIRSSKQINEVISKNKTEIKDNEQYSFDTNIIAILKEIKTVFFFFFEITDEIIKIYDKLNLEIKDFNNDILNNFGKTIDFEEINTIPYQKLLNDWNKIGEYLDKFNPKLLNSNE